MEGFRVLEIKKSVFENNDREADKLREELKAEKTFLLNLMSSPGSGKTTTLMATIAALKDDLRIGVMEADIDSDVDAATIEKSGAKVIQLHTGGMCHLDAGMTKQGLEGLGTDNIALAILENVVNLVCPSAFDSGSVKNALISSSSIKNCTLMYSLCGKSTAFKNIKFRRICILAEFLGEFLFQFFSHLNLFSHLVITSFYLRKRLNY